MRLLICCVAAMSCTSQRQCLLTEMAVVTADYPTSIVLQRGLTVAAYRAPVCRAAGIRTQA